MLNFTQHYTTEKIIVSPYAYEEKVTYRAVAVVVDVRRPNRVKPIYKRKRFVKRTPLIIRVKGLGIVMPPELYDKMQKQITNSIYDQQRKMVASAFGLSDVPQPIKSLSLSDIQEVLKNLQNGY